MLITCTLFAVWNDKKNYPFSVFPLHDKITRQEAEFVLLAALMLIYNSWGLVLI